MKMNTEDVDQDGEPTEPAWIRCSPADLYFRRDKEVSVMGRKVKHRVERPLVEGWRGQ